MRDPQPFKKDAIPVDYLISKLQDRVGIEIEPGTAVDSSEKAITESNIHRPGLALAGYTELFTHQRVQVLGNTECRYLTWLGPGRAREAWATLLTFDLPCVILTAGNRLPDDLAQMAEDRGVPVFRTPLPTVPFITQLRDVLEDQFALQLTLHASLVDVYGIGLLLTGPAGIGKSEIALDLVERGHRLVADDVVIATRKSWDVLMGGGTDIAQHFMEVRGLGIVDVKAMFGVRSIRHQKRVEVSVRLSHWDPDEEYTRIGMVDEMESVLGVDLPVVKLPIVPGKNVTVICEVIAMNHLLRHYGYDPAEEFGRRLQERIAAKTGQGGARPRRDVEWFEHDFE